MLNDGIWLTRDKLDDYLKDLAKEYKKLTHTPIPVELIIVDGASVILNYSFRDSSYDIDAFIQADSCIKESISHVSDHFNLPIDWLNDDFTKTDSFSPKIRQYSIYYRTFSRVLSVRFISREYLIAMKLISFRKYKNDLSDIIGIIHDERKKGTPISKKDINKAIFNLYGEKFQISIEAEQFIDRVLAEENLDTLLSVEQNKEKSNKIILLNQKSKKND